MKVGLISPRVLIRRALSSLLSSTGTVSVVVEGNTILENLEAIRSSRPDTLLVDLSVSGGAEGLSDVARLGPGVRVVGFLDNPNIDACARALQLGAKGCLSTRCSPATFQKALNAVARGERWMPQSAATRAIEELFAGEMPVQKVKEDLTPREWEVLGLLANGFRNKEIAHRLSVSEETAKSHIKSIYRKLKIDGRRNAIFRYFEQVHRLTAQEGFQVGHVSDKFLS